MTITVKFFARLREDLQQDTITIEMEGIQNVADAWTKATGRVQFPSNTFCAINHEHAKPSQIVKNGDEVALFPTNHGRLTMTVYIKQVAFKPRCMSWSNTL